MKEKELLRRAKARFAQDRAPFVTAMLAGMAAHGYAFSNKLVNHDEIESLFGKGATVTSGRWGLEAVKLLFPDWSMPWDYGLVSLLLIAAAACLMLRFLGIRSRFWQGLLAALVVTFPSLTGNFCFMFTAAPYAWAFCLTALAVYLWRWGDWRRGALSLVLLVLALGIYQAYIAVAASLFILKMIADALDGERGVWEIVLDGLKALLLMAVAIAVYYAVTLLVFRFTGAEFNSYVTENVNGSVSLPRRVRMAYDAFWYVFSFRNFYLVPFEVSRYIHIALAVLTLAGLGVVIGGKKKALHGALALFLTLLLPLGIGCMYLIMSRASIHTLVMYSFVTVYFLTALVMERLPVGPVRRGRELTALALSAVVVCNVYFANMVYLKLQLQYENAYAFYTVLSTRIMETEGFDENCTVALVGRQEQLLHRFPELDTELFMAAPADLVNIYSRENLLRNFLGLELPFADDKTTERLASDPRVEAMPAYPYAGSVQMLDGVIVVKLG